MISGVVFLALVVLLLVTTNKKIKAKYNIEKRDGFYRRVHSTQIWGEIYIVLIMLAFLFLIEHYSFEYTLFGLLIPLGIYRSFMEWKYDKPSNHYRLTIASTFFLVVTFVGVLLITTPQIVKETHYVYIYSEDHDLGERVELEIDGKLRRNLIYGDRFEGHFTIADREFFTFKFGKETNETFHDRLITKRFLHTMVERSSQNRGELWIKKDIRSFTGTLNELEPFSSGPVKFAGPAETLEEAMELYEQIGGN